MSDDPRCCGSGTCIIDAEGHCWCGQRWVGNQLVGPGAACAAPAPQNAKDTPSDTPSDTLSHTPPEAASGLAPRPQP